MTSLMLKKVIKKVNQLDFDEQLDLMIYLANSIKNNQNYSAEIRAEIRLKDELSEDKWITTIDENEEIDEEELNNYLTKFIGKGKGCYPTAKDADDFIRQERDKWDYSTLLNS